jgi:asparagine synthase (glutamine-hydrolysing)
MRDLQTGNWIIFNGEVYNFQALQKELQQHGVSFRSGSDTEVVLKALAFWGPDGIRRFRGMFAFAFWDARTRQLILARDPMGVKPLYYVERPGTVLFASETRALLKSGMIAPRVSLQGLQSYLSLGAVQEPATILEGVLALPAGHYAIWTEEGLRLVKYWGIEDCFTHPAPRALSWGDAVDEVRARLETAVRIRLISDAPIGTFLSGGLDSSTVTALAARASGTPVQTVSVVFDEEDYSEKRYVDLVSRRFRTKHTEVRLSQQDFLQLLPKAVLAMDQPTFDGVNTYVVSGQARLAGLTVALSGIGGDELFGGYRSFALVPRLRTLRRWLPPLLRQPAALLAGQLGHDSDQARKLAQWLSYGDDSHYGAEILSRQLFGPADRHRLAAADGHLSTGNGWAFSQRLRDDFNSVSLFELSCYLQNVLLRDTDVMSMAHGLEVREPLLDQDLVELVATLPGSLKRQGDLPKGLLAAAMRQDLPPEVVTRPKMGFTLPFAHWLKGPLRRTVEDSLRDPSVGGEVADLLDAPAVTAVWTRFLEGSASWVRPWSLYVLKQWGHDLRQAARLPAQTTSQAVSRP